MTRMIATGTTNAGQSGSNTLPPPPAARATRVRAKVAPTPQNVPAAEPFAGPLVFVILGFVLLTTVFVHVGRLSAVLGVVGVGVRVAPGHASYFVSQKP